MVKFMKENEMKVNKKEKEYDINIFGLKNEFFFKFNLLIDSILS